MQPYFENDVVTLYHGDCLEVLPELSGVEAFIEDPPYGLGFMGRDWDYGIPGMRFWQAHAAVAKPGAHLFAFGGTRTHHRLMCAIEDAGWELRDTMMYIYAQGFPKSHNIGKGIDRNAIVSCPDCFGSGKPTVITEEGDWYTKRTGVCPRCLGKGKIKGAERDVVGKRTLTGSAAYKSGDGGNYGMNGTHGKKDVPITAPATI